MPSGSVSAYLKTLTNDPGIYKMIDQNGGIIYVGKAKHLKKRVSSYFLSKNHDIKTLVMVSQVASIDTIVTASEHDALVLEAQLIKTLKPKYNINLKDDKQYPYIKLTLQEPFPRVLIVRDRRSDGAKYFGPYPSIGSTKYLQRILHDLFPIRDCTKPIDAVKKQRKCIQYDIGKCIGPCIKKDVKDQYDRFIFQLIDLLNGKDQSLIQKLKKDMRHYAEQREFEQAALIRDRIYKIEKLSSRQQVEWPHMQTTHVWGFAHNETYRYAIIQYFIEGKLLFQKGIYTSVTDCDDGEFMTQSVLNEIAQTDYVPEWIMVPSVYETVFSSLQLDRFFTLKCPKKGLMKQVVDMAHKNAELSLKRLMKLESDTRSMPKQDVLMQAKTDLQLPDIPRIILGFDISHLQGDDIVASSVCFKDGIPLKSAYRKFKIRTVYGQSNDPASIKEVVYRRMVRWVESGQELPQLILIDGGKGQLNFAHQALIQLQLEDKICLVALAKKEELLFLVGQTEPIQWPKHHLVRRLLQAVRDEAHRFAVTFQRTQRKLK